MATTLARCEQYAVLESENVFVIRWYKAATVAALNEIEAEMNKALPRHTDAVGWLAINCDDSPTEPDFSKAASQQVERMRARGLRAIAAVQDDNSMGGKLARITMHVISTFSRGVPVRLFRTPHDACVWLAASVQGVDAAGLERDLHQIQAS